MSSTPTSYKLSDTDCKKGHVTQRPSIPYAVSKNGLLLSISRETIKIKMPEGESKQSLLGDGADGDEYMKHLMSFFCFTEKKGYKADLKAASKVTLGATTALKKLAKAQHGEKDPAKAKRLTRVEAAKVRLIDLAGNVGNMSTKCRRYVEMSMNLGIFACECRHQNSPDTRFLCQKFPTLYPIPERTYAQRSNALPKILTLETDYVQRDATSFAIAVEPCRHHNSNWSCSAHPPVITLCQFDVNFDCCVCSHDHLQAAACIASVP
jgi:hypothetical protein